jgi:excisionase family DNA binding protein
MATDTYTFPTDPRALLSRKQAAQYLNISTRMFAKLFDARELPRTRIGRSVKVPLFALTAYVCRHTWLGKGNRERVAA